MHYLSYQFILHCSTGVHPKRVSVYFNQMNVSDSRLSPRSEEKNSTF